MRKFDFFCFSIIIMIFVSCSGNKLTQIGAEEENDSDTPVNIIEQALPSIMIIPSDQSLRKYKDISTVTLQGQDFLNRNYQKYLLDDKNNKTIIRFIQDKFIQMDYPLSDLEQALKNLNNIEQSNEVNGLMNDSKSMLLYTVSPDFILELDYSFDFGSDIRNHQKELVCNLSIIDPTTEKVLATSQLQSKGNDIEEAVSNISDKDFNNLSKELKDEFTKTITKGREVTIRITVDNGSDVTLNQDIGNGDVLSDYILDYLDNHTKKGTYSLQRNSPSELFIQNARISNLSKNGTQTNAYKWARELCKSLRNNLGIKAVNNSQKLNEIHITIEGRQ